MCSGFMAFEVDIQTVWLPSEEEARECGARVGGVPDHPGLLGMCYVDIVTFSGHI